MNVQFYSQFWNFTSDKKLSADENAIKHFKTHFKEIIPNLLENQLFNADNPRFIMSPHKSLAVESVKTTPGYKMSMERISVNMQ